MSEIVKGVIGGGMALLAGWIVPVALNLLLIEIFVLRNAGDGPLKALTAHSATVTAAAILGASVVGGLVLNMLQTPLYRMLEGYLGWPQWLFERRRTRHLARRTNIVQRLAAIKRLQDALRAAPAADRMVVLNRTEFASMPGRDRQRTAPQRALLREELRRYPIDDNQVLPTRLGNAIRRFEEYGWNRYRLDSQTLWTRLMVVVGEPLRKQVDSAQIGVDFFVCLLYGQLAAAATAVIALAAHPRQLLPPVLCIALVVVLAPVWYRLAVVTTDQWAAAVQTLVDLGRKPLAEAYGVALPTKIVDERVMWERLSRFASREYDPSRAAQLDEHRGPAAAP